MSGQRLAVQWIKKEMIILLRRDHFLLENGMTKKGHWDKSKIAIKGHFVTVFGAKSSVKYFVLVIRGCQCAWNATKIYGNYSATEPN